MSVEKLVETIKKQKIAMNGICRTCREPIKVGKKDIIVSWKTDVDPVDFRKKIEQIGSDLIVRSFFSRSNDDCPGAVYFELR